MFYDGVAVISPHKLAGILALMLYKGPSNRSVFSVALFRTVKRFCFVKQNWGHIQYIFDISMCLNLSLSRIRLKKCNQEAKLKGRLLRVREVRGSNLDPDI